MPGMIGFAIARNNLFQIYLFGMKKARGSQEISEAYHQFQYHLVLFRLFRYAVFGIEVFLVVQPEVCAECLAEAEGDAARQALAFVVGHCQSAGFLIGGFGVALVGHHVVA